MSAGMSTPRLGHKWKASETLADAASISALLALEPFSWATKARAKPGMTDRQFAPTRRLEIKVRTMYLGSSSLMQQQYRGLNLS